MKNIKFLPQEKPGLYKINVNPNFTKIEIKKMLETLFNVKVLKVNTSRRYHSKRSLLNQLTPKPKVVKHAFITIAKKN